MTQKNEVYEDLKQRIIINSLKGGQQLYEKDFMAEYNIGRTPLRDIFHDLQRDGLIEILPKLGTKVVSMSLKDLRETVQLRRELEGLAIELSTKNITPTQLEEFKKILDERKLIAASDPEANVKIAEIDVKIHRLIYKTAGNDQLLQIINVLLDKSTMYWFQIGFTAEEFKEQIDELELLYDAMVKGDPTEARKIMKDHIQYFVELMTSHLF